MKCMKKIQFWLTIIGVGVLFYNIYELIISKFSVSQSVTLIIEAIAGIVLIYLPNLAKKLFKLVFSDGIILFYWFFLFMSVFLGTCLHFMSMISFWDKILHFISPMILTIIGYGIIVALLKNVNITDVSPWLFLLMGFSFAGVCGVFWEFWEFFCDQFFHMNLQRYTAAGGVELVGRAALMDTMGDLLTNTLGSLVLSLFALKKSHNNTEWFNHFKIKRLP
ncbi:hypothetical protein BW731_04065 [Vagococcus martis]|uniref:DUF2238 domain-containing protein n=1 Tax=Vagococcus martis TaxID=1768210 RepID=A0A1V4DG17_9ENTE|nr:hypothetical protein [Vagococcus martis]OPF87438.1 hypothetical protein BW731_04065 [Vagococcus martis]